MTNAKEIARREYRNGAFGNNVARLVRDAGGYLFYTGYSDGFRFTDWRQVKQAWSLFCTYHPQAEAA